MGAAVSACLSCESCTCRPGARPMVEAAGSTQQNMQLPAKALLSAITRASSATQALQTVKSIVSALDDASEVVALVNTSNSKGQTAIAIASELGFTELVQFLLHQGADPWKKNNLGGRTPLHLACLKGRADIVRILLEDLPTQFGSGPCDTSTRFVDVKTLCGFTPLHFAVRSGDAATIQAVLEHEPNIVATSTHDSLEANMNYVAGTTPLHIAAITGNLEVACALMRHYALRSTTASGSTVITTDPRRVPDSAGRLPWNVAAGVRRISVAQALKPSWVLSRFLPEIEHVIPGSVPSLQALAATALKQSLLTSLDRIQGLLVATATCSNSTQLSLKLSSAHAGCQNEETTITPKLSRTAMIEMLEEKEPGDRRSVTSVGAVLQVQNMIYSPANSMKLCGSVRTALQTTSQRPLLSWQDSKIENMASNNLSPHCSGSNCPSLSCYGHAGMCQICFDCVAFVRPISCHHAVCRRCAKEMVESIRKSPLACPFCRVMIDDFTIA